MILTEFGYATQFFLLFPCGWSHYLRHGRIGMVEDLMGEMEIRS